MTNFDTYSDAIRKGFQFALANDDQVVVLGQGLWSPWYVGNTMKDLDIEFGHTRVIDTPVSESAVTGAAVGAAIAGMKSIVVHPRMDFMLYAIDAIVNEAAKWSYMFDGKSSAGFTLRAIINRGGEQGAQHSQSLHSWFAHIPGLRVVMPYSPQDAHDLLVASIMSPDPVLYIDDRWLYDDIWEQRNTKIPELSQVLPSVIEKGDDITIVGCGYSTKLAVDVAKELTSLGFSSDVVDLRILNPIDHSVVSESVNKTGRLLVVDGGWKTCGIAGEVISGVSENIDVESWKARPARVTIGDCPAPSAKSLEDVYYPTQKVVLSKALSLINGDDLND